LRCFVSMTSPSPIATTALKQNGTLIGLKAAKRDGFGMDKRLFGGEPGRRSDGRRLGRQPKIEDRKRKAFSVYLELLDTADWIRRQLRAQLESFDLTIEGFRVLEMIHREGTVTTPEFCRRRGCTPQAMDHILQPLQTRGWVRYEVIDLPPVPVELTHLAKSKRDEPRRGRRAGQVRLTPGGEKFMRVVLPRHAKLVFAFMRALNMREQDSLGKACRKLREGDVLKLLHEISMQD
jgi:DNA-binding MarR family transcriptional regulator